jgi:SagB-type dehydrogenase family enzyme
MSKSSPRTYDELDPAPRWPASRLCHENSKLTERRAEALQEQIELFAADSAGAPAAQSRYASRPVIALPRAKRRLFGARLDDALRDRRSQRGPFASRPLELTELGALLDLSVGARPEATPKAETKSESPSAPTLQLRPFPSAGGLYPVEVYVAALSCASVERGIHHYDPGKHALAKVAPCPAKGELDRLIFADNLGDGAAAALILTGVFERAQAKYGERGYRFVLLEAGHAAQNVLLAAQSMGLAGAPIGGFCEDALGAAMGLDATRESPVYVVLLGAPGTPR